MLMSIWVNKPVEKVTFSKTASSAGSKIGSYFLSSRLLQIVTQFLILTIFKRIAGS
jgi:hypothetical protein